MKENNINSENYISDENINRYTNNYNMQESQRIILKNNQFIHSNVNVQINQNNIINTNNLNGQQMEITYEKNEVVKFMICSQFESKTNKDKTRNSNYNLVDTDDPDLFDGKIKCVRLKCIFFGILIFFLNSFRLIYLIFLHLGYPAIIWGTRCCCAVSCFFCILFSKEVRYYDGESGYDLIDSETNCEKALGLCKNCGIAFYKFMVNLIKCPIWIFGFIVDCFYDIKNRALDNARTGCYKFIHYDFGLYEKVIEDPFNNYNKKRHIILTTDPNDENVIYGDAVKNNIII